LTNVVAALHSPCRFACCLNRWEKKPHKDSNNGYRYKQFGQRKSRSSRRICSHVQIIPVGQRSNIRLIVGMTGLPVNHREYEMNAFSKLQRRHRAQGLARASIRVKKTYKLS
jgi:hypothetical protein